MLGLFLYHSNDLTIIYNFKKIIIFSVVIFFMKNSNIQRKNLKKQRSLHDYLFFNGYRFEISIETLILLSIIIATLALAISIPNPTVALTV